MHVVFGAGQIGASLARTLARQGHPVRVVRRSGRPVDDLEVVAADATDPEAVLAASRGATVIHHCLNPSAYTGEAWTTELPPMNEALIAAAIAHDARLVVLDNLYAYGPTREARREDSPMHPNGPKGRQRAGWHARLHAATAEGLRWTAGRPGDFWGPGTSDQSLMAMSRVEGLGRGRPALLLGDARAPHSFSYVPDVVDSLITLALAEADVEGRVWHLPVHTIAPGDLVRRLARAQGRRGWYLALPGWFLRALAPVVPFFATLTETLYQWERPFLSDDSAFRARFTDVGTPIDAAVEATIARLESEGRPADTPQPA